MAPNSTQQATSAAAALAAERPRRLPDLLPPFRIESRMQAADLVAYVDVDDTLVRSTGTKRIPMTAVVDHVRGLHGSGVTLYCWSAGGADYARRSARELGIEGVFAGFLPKPHLLVDDQPPSEWPNFVVARPAGLASMTVQDHISALAHRGRASKT